MKTRSTQHYSKLNEDDNEEEYNAVNGNSQTTNSVNSEDFTPQTINNYHHANSDIASSQKFGSEFEEPHTSNEFDNEFDERTIKNVGLLGLFRYASFYDRLLVVFGMLLAFVEGAGQPLMSLVFGNMGNTLVSAIRNGFKSESNQTTAMTPLLNSSLLLTTNVSLSQQTTLQQSSSVYVSPFNLNLSEASQLMTSEEFEQIMATFSLYYILLGVAVFFASMFQIWCLQTSCESQIFKIRRLFFRNVLRQELAWFDKNHSGDLASKLNDDIERVRDGLGEQFGLGFKQAALFVFGFMVGFTISWRLTLVLLAVSPFLAAFSSYIGILFRTSVKREQQKYAEAGAVAEEVLVSIRTVFALNGQKTELKAYKKKLDEGKAVSLAKYVKLSIMVGLSLFVLYATYALALYVSIFLIDDNLITPGAAMACLMSVMMASNALGNIVPPMQTVITAMSSASLIFNIIESKPKIDASKDRGLKLSKVTANIKFENVTFCYPLRPTVPVLRNLNLELEQGKTIAICGKTGSGKSTIINLLLRFYDPNSGAVYLDNCDYTDLNTAWLRSLVGLVEQEPALFDCSILENIALGAANSSQQTFERIIAAAKTANAHEFILNLPDGYQTRCGDRGYQMSGGQKQRIAIARALLSDPRILLLDEATSALDSESESIVQLALNKARKGRTTVVIAHRLSTIKDADTIGVMHNGQLVERGNHDELMEARGHYYNLVTSQVFEDEKNAANQLDNQSSDRSRFKSEDDDDYEASDASGSNGFINRSVDRMQSSFKGSSGLLDRSIGERARRRSASGATTDSTTRYSLSKNQLDWTDSKKLGYEDLSAIEYLSTSSSSKLTYTDIKELLRPEAVYVSIGILFACLSGALMPLFGLLYSEVFDTLTKTGEELFAEGKFWSLMFVVFAIANMLMIIFRIVFISRAIENNASRVRVECFQSILRQSVGWFDEAEHAPQRLTTRLASDVSQIKAIINARIATFFSGIATILLALVIAFWISWKMASLQLVIIPFLLYVGRIQMIIIRADKTSYMKKFENASKHATEAMEHVKLIQAIRKEQQFSEKFVELIRLSTKDATAQSKKFAFIYALSVSAIFFVYGASFRFGGYLIAIGELDPINLFRAFFAIAFSAVAIGQWGGFGGDLSQVEQSIKNVLNLKSLQPEIDNMSSGGIKPQMRGKITFSNVHFSYPTRPDTVVLKNLNLTINPGSTLALVGPSGNGKSTVAALLLRFYDPTEGVIKIDNYDLRCINLEHLRRNVATVSQEPLLFKASIRENILYGLDARNYSMRDIINAAKLANIDDFIARLPDGYETQVGDRGTQMSGGQKQRIAIARAIIRNPAVLILDEATSALDSESEALVSQALEKACVGKTCIKIAHRLSTIRDADQIAVVERGCIVELGTHDQLMALGKKGFYFRLMQKQEITS